MTDIKLSFYVPLAFAFVLVVGTFFALIRISLERPASGGTALQLAHNMPDYAEEQEFPSGGELMLAGEGKSALPPASSFNPDPANVPHSDKPSREYIFNPKTVYYKDKVLVLMYHHIDEKDGGITITPKLFHNHLQALKDHQFNVISMEELLDFLKTDRKIPPNAVVLTFDDGYESFYVYAYPELKRMGMPATNFVVVSYIGSDYPRLPFLTWDQLKEMKRDGMGFYSHTHNLHRKVSIPNGDVRPAMTSHALLDKADRIETDAEYRQRVIYDLVLAETVLRQELGPQEPVVCFPYGAYDATVLKLAEEVGIRYVFTTKEGINTRDSREILRLNAGVPYMSAEALVNKMKKYK